jgi:hypothetical protein
MDIFIEKIIKRQKKFLDFLIIGGAIALAVLIAVFLFLNAFILFILFTPGLIFLIYYIITLRNIEYEYAVTNGDLDIDIIINQSKRKRLFSASCKEFEAVARVDSPQYMQKIKNCKNVKDYSSRKEGSEVWFAFTKQEGKDLVILFEPSKKMIDNFTIYIPRKVHRDI